MHKSITLFSVALCLILVASSSFMVESAAAQVGVTTPSMPSFGLMYHPLRWYMPPTYGVDPSTGKAIMTQEGYYKVDRLVELSISNQPFTAYTDSKGNAIDLYYNIRWKYHDNVSWSDLLSDGARCRQNKEFYLTGLYIGFEGNADPTAAQEVFDYTPGQKIDFQVQASIGYYTEDNVFVGNSSGWTSTQTLTIPNDDSNTSSTPTIVPQQPDAQGDVFFGLSWEHVAIAALAVVVVVLAVLLVAVVVFWRKRAHRQVS